MVTESHAAARPAEERFAAQARVVGAQVHTCGSQAEIVALVQALAIAPAAGRALVAPSLAASDPSLVAAMTVVGLELGKVDVADPAATVAGVTVGISRAVLGLAETGSLVLADDLADRLVRMLSPQHVVILDAARIVPGLDEGGTYLRRLIAGETEAPGRYISFITGPSRTADIEMSLTVGAHGPAALHIAVLTEA